MMKDPNIWETLAHLLTVPQHEGNCWPQGFPTPKFEHWVPQASPVDKRSWALLWYKAGFLDGLAEP